MNETLFGLGLGFVLLIPIIWLLPIIFILKSDKTTGTEKLLWLLAVLFISWFAWILYLFLAPVVAKE